MLSRINLVILFQTERNKMSTSKSCKACVLIRNMKENWYELTYNDIITLLSEIKNIHIADTRKFDEVVAGYQELQKEISEYIMIIQNHTKSIDDLTHEMKEKEIQIANLNNIIEIIKNEGKEKEIQINNLNIEVKNMNERNYGLFTEINNKFEKMGSEYNNNNKILLEKYNENKKEINELSESMNKLMNDFEIKFSEFKTEIINEFNKSEMDKLESIIEKVKNSISDEVRKEFDLIAKTGVRLKFK